MLPYRDSRLTKIILVAFFLLVAIYAYYEARGLLYGPTIDVVNRVVETSDSLITIEGKAARIATLTMNGASIPVTEDGTFSETYALSPGYNRIELRASDRYGKSTERAIEIIYTPSTSSGQAPSTTSTPVAPQE